MDQGSVARIADGAKRQISAAPRKFRGAAKKSRFFEGLAQLRQDVAADEDEIARAGRAPLRLQLAGAAGDIEPGAGGGQRLGGLDSLFGIDGVGRAQNRELGAAGLEARG